VRKSWYSENHVVKTLVKSNHLLMCTLRLNCFRLKTERKTGAAIKPRVKVTFFVFKSASSWKKLFKLTFNLFTHDHRRTIRWRYLTLIKQTLSSLAAVLTRKVTLRPLGDIPEHIYRLE
jgi:hypothetical protein